MSEVEFEKFARELAGKQRNFPDITARCYNVNFCSFCLGRGNGNR